MDINHRSTIPQSHFYDTYGAHCDRCLDKNNVTRMFKQPYFDIHAHIYPYIT